MLKRIITAATILVATTAPLAAETDECVTLGDTAAALMEARQAGVPMSETMSYTNGNEFLEALTVAAYSVSRFTTDRYRQGAVTDFRNEVEMICYENR